MAPESLQWVSQGYFPDIDNSFGAIIDAASDKGVYSDGSEHVKNLDYRACGNGRRKGVAQWRRRRYTQLL